MSAMAVLLGEGGLQDVEAVAKHKLFVNLSCTAIGSRPAPQVALFLLLVLPPMVLARVATSWCPAFLLLHVVLLCPSLTR